jgi:iron complex outermembrane receptor protein
LNADIFYYNYKNYQVNYLGFINPQSAGIFGVLTANAEGATSYGAEIEARYIVTANDEVDLTLDPLRSKFKTLVVPGFFGGTYSGDVLPFAPYFSANLGYEHNWNFRGGARFTARAETHFESSSWVTFNEHPGTEQDAHTISNVFLTYHSPDARWSATAYVKNLENKAVLANGQGGPAGLETVDIGPPRTYGAQVSAKF